MLSILFLLLSGINATSLRKRSLDETALVIASSTSAADEAVSILNAHDQPSQLLIMAANGTDLPPLETISGSNSVGNFGLIIIIGLATYDYGGTIGWASPITSAQWTDLYSYQSKI